MCGAAPGAMQGWPLCLSLALLPLSALSSSVCTCQVVVVVVFGLAHMLGVDLNKIITDYTTWASATHLLLL